MKLALATTGSAPGSARAWNSLCLLHYEASEQQPGEELDKAIDACSEGANAPYAISALTNLLVFKSIRGDTLPADWDRFFERLHVVARTAENRKAAWILVNNMRNGVAMDEDRVLQAIAIASDRGWLPPVQHVAIGYFIMTETTQPQNAYPYFQKAIVDTPAGASLARELVLDLEARGKTDWARRLRMQAQDQGKWPTPH